MIKSSLFKKRLLSRPVRAPSNSRRMIKSSLFQKRLHCQPVRAPSNSRRMIKSSLFKKRLHCQPVRAPSNSPSNDQIISIPEATALSTGSSTFELPSNDQIISFQEASAQSPGSSAIELATNDQSPSVENITEPSPCKYRKGVPVWYAGQKISPAFTNHIFWPSPQKKTKSNKVRELFPACASSHTWREVYRRKEEDKLKKGTPKCKDNSKEVKFKATGKKTKPVTSSVARQSKKTASSSIASSQSKGNGFIFNRF